jgi:sugar/nucleoside kinase (ribokinase family)
VTAPTLDILAIGNAIVDVLAATDDAFLEREGHGEGADAADRCRAGAQPLCQYGPGREVSGGSAANTLAGAAMMGARCGFIGQVAGDQLGEVFVHDIRAQGIAFDIPRATLRCRPGAAWCW